MIKSAKNQTDVQIWLPREVGLCLQGEDLQGFQCAEPHVSHKYKYKHVKATVANLPQAKDATAQTSTKVTPRRVAERWLTIFVASDAYVQAPSNALNSG